MTIPSGYNTVWIRVLGDRWNAVKAYFRDGAGEDLGIWCGGKRNSNKYCPDGALADSYWDRHEWVPIAAGRAGRLALIAKSHTNSAFWISGLAFSKNPWNHAVQSAVGICWASNGGNATGWYKDNPWNNDQLAKIEQKTNQLLKVPVVPNGVDKLVYLVEHNDNWCGVMHDHVTVAGARIERLRSTYDNPFARHWNSKFYQRYVAARIPADQIPANVKHIDVRINMSTQNHSIHFREIGTHDYTPNPTS